MMQNQNPMLMYPINVGTKCRILLEQAPYYQECLKDAIWTWFHSRIPAGMQWNSFVSQYNIDSQSLCCYRWNLLDCLSASIRQVCHLNNNEFRSYMNKRDMLIEHYEIEDCRQVRYDQWFTCHMSWWTLTLIIIISALLCITLGLLLAWNWRWIGNRMRSKPRNIHNNRSTTSRALTDL